ncbi:MAG: NAD(P)/FAD-dependent oxidoreductase [Myxococcota bacterium]
MAPSKLRIAVIGAGVSGIAAASIFNRQGHSTVLFEKGRTVGGVWANTYPGVSLQNNARHYALTEFPWPFTPDYHPSGEQIRRYLGQAVEGLGLDVRTQHTVVRLDERDRGWLVHCRHPDGEAAEPFDFVLIANGQYSGRKHAHRFPGQDDFGGAVLTERDIDDLSIFDNKTTAVIGFGKSAVDMASTAVAGADRVHHVFRTRRWLVPYHILGLVYSQIFFCRAGTVLMKSWAHPTRVERFIHRRMNWLVAGNWAGVTSLMRRMCLSHARGLDASAQRRLRTVMPDHDFVGDLRSAAALAPPGYYSQVARGEIVPHHAELRRFTRTGIELSDGSSIDCDQVLLCLGSATPSFPFLPEPYRQLVETEPDGVQLYRHLIHPEIRNLAFSGYNHGFLHIPTVEVATLWLCAMLRGDITLPATADMLASIERIRSWKRDHIHFEPSRSCAVNTRFQQYLDILLLDLGLSPYRKLPNLLAEVFAEYDARDYAGLADEYEHRRTRMTLPRPVLPLDT